MTKLLNRAIYFMAGAALALGFSLSVATMAHGANMTTQQKAFIDGQKVPNDFGPDVRLIHLSVYPETGGIVYVFMLKNVTAPAPLTDAEIEDISKHYKAELLKMIKSDMILLKATALTLDLFPAIHHAYMDSTGKELIALYTIVYSDIGI